MSLNRLFGLTCLGLVLASATVEAQGAAIAVAPTRILVTPNQRAAEAAITNNSDKTVRYKVELVDLVMGVSGTTREVSGSAYSVREMVRYMPKVVTLGPGKRQTIRIMVERPEGLADGDYHSHMLFNEVPMKPGVSGTEVDQDGVAKEQAFSVDIGMSYSMGIPLVVQQGMVSSSVALISASLVRDGSGTATGVSTTLTRSGNGEGVTSLVLEANGKQVATPRTVRIYREVDQVEIYTPFVTTGEVDGIRQVTLKQFVHGHKKGEGLLKEMSVQ